MDATDKAREEFHAEAQEIIETFGRNLLALESTLKSGADDPALVNEAFRAVHTLKGLAGLFGAQRMGALSHRLEDVLDHLRLGRMPLDDTVLDVLFSAVDAYQQLLLSERQGLQEPLTVVDDLVERLGQLASGAGAAGDLTAEYEIDTGLLAVLTEYEEHRLRTNVEQGLRLYRLRVQFELATIDKALEEMKTRAKKHGEIITYLPTGEASSPDSIELDLLMASRDDLATLIGTLGADNVVIEEVPRRAYGAHSMPPARSMVPEPPGAIEAGEGADAVEGAARSIARTVRVDIRKLDHLMNIVGELTIVRGVLARLAERVRSDGNRALGTELGRVHRSFERRLTELQGAILEVRMVPLGQVFDRLARAVRQISREVNKEIRLVITGSDTEIDKLIVEELSDPLMHMIRNAIDHGIETHSVRASVGKPSAGTIALNAYQKGNHVMIEVEDDGAGIDELALVEHAVRAGKLSPTDASDLSRPDVLGLIFLPGVTTRDVAGSYSGRGVGMDVVKTNIAKIGGVIDVQSEMGIGTKMTITLPITLAIVSALIIELADQTLAIPMAAVSEAIVFEPNRVRIVDGKETLSLRGVTLPLCRLERLLQFPPAREPRRRFVVVASIAQRRLGLLVDHLVGQQDIVIKPLGSTLTRVRGFAGASELGDQRVALVLDAGSILEEVLAPTEVGLSVAEGHG